MSEGLLLQNLFQLRADRLGQRLSQPTSKIFWHWRLAMCHVHWICWDMKPPVSNHFAVHDRDVTISFFHLNSMQTEKTSHAQRMTLVQEDESLFVRKAIAAYRTHDEQGQAVGCQEITVQSRLHRTPQTCGCDVCFADYNLRVKHTLGTLSM